MFVTIRKFTLGSIVLLLAACGGGDSDSDSYVHEPAAIDTVPDNSTGVLLDSPIEGIKYQSLSHSGITDISGHFIFNPSEKVSFYIGDVLIAEIFPEKIVTPQLLMSSSDPRSETVLNFIRLMQTIDDDDNADNGIKVTTDIAQKLTDSVGGGQLNFQISSVDFENSIIVKDILIATANPALVSAEIAYTHLMGTLKEELSISTVYSFNASLKESNLNGYVHPVNFHKERDDGIILATKNVYKDFFVGVGGSFGEIGNPAPALPLAYDISNEKNMNPFEAKIEKAWSILEGIEAQDPSLVFVMKFDSEPINFFLVESNYFSVGIQFEFNDTVYEIESNFDDNFLNFAKNNVDIYGNIEFAHSWVGKTLSIHLPISTFGLTKDDLFDVTNKANMRLFYRNLDSGSRAWNSSVSTRLYFEKPTYHNPDTVIVNRKATENFDVIMVGDECDGRELEHDGMREVIHSIDGASHFDAYSEFSVGITETYSAVQTVTVPGCISVGLVTFDSSNVIFESNPIQVVGSEFKLTSHDVVRLFSPVALYGNYHVLSIYGSYWDVPNHNGQFILSTVNSYVEEKLGGNVSLGGDKLLCPSDGKSWEACVGEQVKPWSGEIVLN